MCTAILLHRPGAAWPLLLAANRDEMLDRPWRPPAPHWPALPEIIGGLDMMAGGTWLAMNKAGVVAAVLNRRGSLGPQAGKRSRGELPLKALAHDTAAEAAATVAALDGGAYRPFNLLVADTSSAWFIRGLGKGHVLAATLPPGFHMVTSTEPNDLKDPRIARHLRHFMAAAPPQPPEWRTWPGLLADGSGDWAASLNVPPRRGFGTASAALIGVAAHASAFLFAPGAPHQAPFVPVGSVFL